MGHQIKFIVNPRSGETKTTTFLRALRHYCKYFKLNHSIDVTKDKHHGIFLADEAFKQGFDTIVAVGGDGTMHEVLQGLVGKKVTMGIIPFGSSNDFARTVGLPKDLKEAIRIISHRNIKPIDIDHPTILSNQNKVY